MAESFLKEQLERIRKLTERMSALQNNAAELSDAMAEDRAALRQGPLHEFRDYRLYSDVSDANARHAVSQVNTRQPRRSEVGDSPRRRRRS